MMESVDVKIVWERLSGAVNAATVAQKFSAFSTAVTEANDFACGLMTTEGELIVASDIALPSFSLMMPNAVRQLRDRKTLDDAKPGDVFIWNDPWDVSAQVNDILILQPIFWEGSLQGYAGSIAHNPDLGGVQQWWKASDVFEEGLQIPPLRLFAEGQRNEGIWEMIGANSRVPEQCLGDIDSQIAAVEAISNRVEETILPEHGEGLGYWGSEVLARSEELMKRAIRELPVGEYRAEDSFSAHDLGIDKGELQIELKVCVSIGGEEIEVSYDGTSEQVHAGVNSLSTFTRAYTMYTLRALLAPGLRQNDGFARPVRVHIPEGSVLGARRPLPCLNRHQIGQRVCDLMNQALANVVPERVHAENGSAPTWVVIFTATEGPFQAIPRLFAMAGGTGARKGRNGQVLHYPTNLSNTPLELFEKTLPVRFVEKRLRRDSGGDGEWRGGMGQCIEMVIEGPMVYVVMGGNVDRQPRGILGGECGESGEIVVDGIELRPSSGLIDAGSRMTFRTPGGGGYGRAG